MLDELIKKLRDHNPHEVTLQTGVSYSTILDLLAGRNQNPKLSTLNALHKFVTDEENAK